MEIKRDLYLNKLIGKKHNGLIKVVTGIRRCGKSYLLFELFKSHLLSAGVDRRHIIEIAFDSFENKRLRGPNVLYPYLKEQIKEDGEYYVLLDEVQLLDEFEVVLNSLIRMKNVDVYVTGSNARFLSKDVITEFRGRGDEVHMYPLNFRQLEETHTMENIIFNELKIRGYNVDVGVVTVNGVNEKGHGIRRQLEIDFVCNKGSKRCYIQSAYTIPDQAKMEQEQRSLMLTGDGFKKAIITKDTPAPHYNEDGVLVMGVYDFLLGEGSLER